MVDKNQYQAFLRAKIKGAIQEARAASTLTHPGVKGNVLEILISKLFRPLLPADIGVGTGQIIEQYRGLMSNQMDIVLYDKSIVPPVLFDKRTGLFPVEATLYTIEVKTKLNATELSIAHNSAKALANFCYLPGLENADGSTRNHPIEKVRSVIFGLSSDLTGNNLNEATRYEKIYKENNDLPFLRAICIAGSEYWYDNGEYWTSFVKQDEYDEILSFIGGVTNTYKKVASSRYSPNLGCYIVPDGKIFLGPQTRIINRIEVICENCENSLQFKPDIGKVDITINGAISCSNPCPICGGNMKSENGKYTFKNGDLISIID